MRKYFVAVALLIISASAVARSDESKTETFRLKKLKASVLVRFDEYGIPSLNARSIHDLMFAEGFIHARDRLWQMDINRRRTTGRMAELLGKAHVGEDFNAHIAQLPEVSKKIWAQCAPEECSIFKAYADGVNAYISNMKALPAEYQKIGMKPAPWSPVDSIAIGRGMAWGLSSDIGLEIALGVIAKTIGKTALLRLLPLDGVDPITIVDSSISSFPAERFNVPSLASLDPTFFSPDRPFLGPSVGSNNWVVAGSRTASGAPILSNDTHMGMSNPCDWYEIHLRAPGLHAAGLSIPGTPGLLIGHNERIGWGVTQARYDVSDAYVEKLDPARPDTHYIFKGESRPFEKIVIPIRYTSPEGMKTEERTLLSTVHGPVVYEADRPRTVISFRWTGFEPTHEDLAFWGFMRARNLKEFKTALAFFEVGAQNFVYADIDGNIFYRSQGKVPIRDGYPLLPLDGASGKYEWTGYIPYDKLPHAENPSRGYVVTANNKQAGKDFPYYLGGLYDKGYRARRITNLILESKNITLDRMREIQADVYSMPAEKMLPLLESALAKSESLPESSASALRILKNWDFIDAVDSPAPTIFYTWLKYCTINMFKSRLPAEVFNQVGRTEVVYPILLSDKKPPIDVFDDPKTPAHETKDDLLAHSFNDAVANLEQRFGADPAAWTWGKIHRVQLGHTLGGDFNIPAVPSDGGSDSVNVADFGLLGDNFNFGHGPNMRFSVELTRSGVRARNVIVGGQSTNRNSPNYRDQFDMWLAKKTHPVLFIEKDVAAHTLKTIVLKP